MARPLSRHPTELELQILKILWRRAPLTVRQVRQELAATRELAHTSVITMLTIMVDKGYVERAKAPGGHLYRPRIAEGVTAGGMLRDIVDRAYDGSAEAAMLNLLEMADLDQAEIQRIRAILKRPSGETKR